MLTDLRTRRVKCDESKPSCKRCQKFGVRCDGYQIFVSSNTPQRRTPPKGVDIPKPQPPVQSIISRISSRARFENDLELRYFRIFCDQISSHIAIPHRLTLWEQLIPQASEAEPFIRHILVAIGSLSKGLGFAPSPHERATVENPQAEHQYALQQYGKALIGMRKAAENGEPNMRTALIACLLVFCFETLQGRQGAACALASSGITLFHDRGAKKTRQTIEDDLIQAFTSLDQEVLLLLGNRPLAVTQRLFEEDTKKIRQMPRIITTLDEAMKYWQLIKTRNLHLMNMGKLIQKPPTPIEELGDPVEKDHAVTEANLKASYSEVGAPPLIQCECKKCIQDIHHWLSATDQLFNELTDKSSIIIANLLGIQAHMHIINISGIAFTTEIIYDTLTPQFEAIVELSTSIHGYRKFSSERSGVYPFDFGIIPGLFTVGARCRDHDIRTRAIDLMSASHYREGFWDSLAAAGIARWLRDVEEEDGKAGEFIPEERRVILTGADTDLFRRRGKVSCLRRGGGLDGSVSRETVIWW